MKLFEEMTMLEKMKVLEEDYIKRQKNAQKNTRIFLSIYTTFCILVVIFLFVLFTVLAFVCGKATSPYIGLSIVFGLITIAIIYLIVRLLFELKGEKNERKI